MLATPAVPAVKVPQLHVQHSGLYAVHAIVETKQIVQVTARLAVVALRPYRCRQRAVVGDDRTSFPKGTKVLAGVKAETTDIPDGADAASLVAGAMGLARVLHHGQVGLPGDGHDRVHVRRLPVQMDGNDGPRPRSHGRRDALGIDG